MKLKFNNKILKNIPFDFMSELYGLILIEDFILVFDNEIEELEIDLNFISKEFKAALTELYNWKFGSGNLSVFTDKLYYLMEGADIYNMKRISRGFPEYCIAFQLCSHHESEDVFFKTIKEMIDE